MQMIVSGRVRMEGWMSRGVEQIDIECKMLHERLL